jgi:hypothetical protein
VKTVPSQPIVYEPSKPAEKELKEWKKCTLSFSKDDIVMLYMVRKDGIAIASEPIILSPETIRITMMKKPANYTDPKIYHPGFLARLDKKALYLYDVFWQRGCKKYYIHKRQEGQLPSSLLLDSKTMPQLPVMAPRDLFMLLIDTEYHKTPSLSAAKKLINSLRLPKWQEAKFPISKMSLDAETAALLPAISPDDLFVLTIITNHIIGIGCDPNY